MVRRNVADPTHIGRKVIDLVHILGRLEAIFPEPQIEQRSLTVWRLRHLLDEACKLLQVPGLDLGQLFDPRQIVGVV